MGKRLEIERKIGEVLNPVPIDHIEPKLWMVKEWGPIVGGMTVYDTILSVANYKEFPIGQGGWEGLSIPHFARFLQISTWKLMTHIYALQVCELIKINPGVKTNQYIVLPPPFVTYDRLQEIKNFLQKPATSQKWQDFNDLFISRIDKWQPLDPYGFVFRVCPNCGKKVKLEKWKIKYNWPMTCKNEKCGQTSLAPQWFETDMDLQLARMKAMEKAEGKASAKPKETHAPQSAPVPPSVMPTKRQTAPPVVPSSAPPSEDVAPVVEFSQEELAYRFNLLGGLGIWEAPAKKYMFDGQISTELLNNLMNYKADNPKLTGAFYNKILASDNPAQTAAMRLNFGNGNGNGKKKKSFIEEARELGIVLS